MVGPSRRAAKASIFFGSSWHCSELSLPWPSLPKSPLPQLRRAPSAVMARLYSYPADAAMTLWQANASIFLGCLWS